MTRWTSVLAALALLAGCGEDKASPAGGGSSDDTGQAPTDADGDGYDADADCDDSDAAVHPGAPELCNMQDDDCDGQIDDSDDDLSDGTTWYPDADGDGYGDPDAPTLACAHPADHVDAAGDCDDTDAEINPDATEHCDNVDENCNGEVDESPIDPSTWYTDADADGYGAAALPTPSCEPPSGAVAVGGDCNDDRDDIYPDAPEVCADGEDSNCDGRDGAIGLSDADALECSTARVVGAADQRIGTAVASAGDWMGTGFPQALIGAPGAVYVVQGPLSGGLDLTATHNQALGIDDPETGTGHTLAGVGDVDGDGYDDLLIGSPGNDDTANNAGAAYLVHGPLSSTEIDDHVQLRGDAFDDAAGAAVAAAGDVDGDGLPDMLIGAPHASRLSAREGAVYLVTTTGPIEAGDLSAATAEWTGPRDAYWIGAVVADGGDLNGDGYRDSLVGIPHDRSYTHNGGALAVLGGPVTDGAWDTEQVLPGEAAEDEAGTSIAGGVDVNGDGYDDVLVGAPLSDEPAAAAGAAYLVLGPTTTASRLSDAAAILRGGSQGDRAGTAVALPGDADGDGLTDLLIGGPGESSNPSPGGIWLISGPVSGTLDLDTTARFLAGELDGDDAGISVAGVGDLNTDGQPDIAVGAPAASAGAGTFYLLSGGAVAR